MPAMARIAETTRLGLRIWAEVPDDLPGYLPVDDERVTWLTPPAGRASALADGRGPHRVADGARILLDGR